jgi:hypothetical protein|tara:strand:+ start:2701 stop:2961 length:261 start_codon:yes stop_codon:yes gene_type:complete
MEKLKSKFKQWETLRKEVYMTHSSIQIVKKYNSLFNVEVELSHSTHISVLIKKIVKDEVKGLKKKDMSLEEVDDLVNSLKFDLDYN